jgi:hypothetical protein
MFFLTLLAGFGIPALLTHFGVAAAAGSLLSGTLGSAAAKAIAGTATKAAGNMATSQVNRFLNHVAQGGEVTAEHRQWLAQQPGVLTTPPKFEPVQPTGPIEFTTPKEM